MEAYVLLLHIILGYSDLYHPGHLALIMASSKSLQVPIHVMVVPECLWAPMRSSSTWSLITFLLKIQKTKTTKTNSCVALLSEQLKSLIFYVTMRFQLVILSLNLNSMPKPITPPCVDFRKQFFPPWDSVSSSVRRVPPFSRRWPACHTPSVSCCCSLVVREELAVLRDWGQGQFSQLGNR